MNLFPVVLFSAYSLSNYKKGYYNSNDTIYYLYDRCSKFNQEKCEWYRYDSKKDDWSLVLNNKTVKKPVFGGLYWDSYNSLYTKFDINKQYYDCDWYKELHPPTPENGYYNYDDKIYYYYYGWYILNNDEWVSASDPTGDIIYNPDTYYDSDKTISDTYDFEDSDYYASSSYDYDDDDSWWSSSSNDSAWDSSSSWDSSDSWDSGGSDWGSDW